MRKPPFEINLFSICLKHTLEKREFQRQTQQGEWQGHRQSTGSSPVAPIVTIGVIYQCLPGASHCVKWYKRVSQVILPMP